MVLVWKKRRWLCRNKECGTKSWTETTPEVRPRYVLSERARREAVRQVGQDGMSVAAAARGLGVNWHTAMRAVREIGQPMVEAQSGTLRGGGCGGWGWTNTAGGDGPTSGLQGSAASTPDGWWKWSKAVLALRPGASWVHNPPKTKLPSKPQRWIRGGGICG